MSVVDQESTKDIISNLLGSSHGARGSEAIVMQSREDDGAARDASTRDRNRKLTLKGKEYMIETLRHHRDAANKRLAKQIKKVNSSLEEVKDVEILTSEAEELDSLKEDLNQAFKHYHDLMETEEEREVSYRYFDLIDREFSECRLKISSRIHAIERKAFKENSSATSSHSGVSSSTKSSKLSGSSARSRKIKAAAKAAKLEAEMKYLDKEAELKRIKKMKELEMAKAERDAMKALEAEENVSPTKQSELSSQRIQEQSGLNVDATPFVLKDFTTPLRSEQSHLPTFEVSTSKNPFVTSPSGLPLMPVKSEAEVKVSPTPFNPSPTELPCFPVKMERQSLGPGNTFTPQSLQLQRREGPSPSEVTLQDIVKLQTRQTELSALIAENQRISSLPIQEPPIFNGNYFDYPVFMRAFETIIETRVSANKERLYFLNKYTTGKAKDVIKGFVTLTSGDSYRQAKDLLGRRFGDPHRVSNAYKSRLKNWPQIGEGQSNDLQAFSDFLGQCEEAMRSMQFLSDLDSVEVLKQVSSKLPSYSGVKWCRHAFELKKNHGRTVTFHDLVKFVETEADLATDPVFSPDALKSERKKPSEKDKKAGHKTQRQPPNLNSMVTTTGDPLRTNTSTSDPKGQSKSRICPACSKDHTLSSCDEFKKKTVKERLDFIQSVGLCFGCLSKGHYSKNCRRRLTCQRCGKPHPTILHNDPEDKKESKDSVETVVDPDQSSSNTSSVCHTVGERNSITNSLILPVWLYHKDSPEKKILIYALLDDASDSTFIKYETIRDLGLKGPEVKLNLYTMLGKEEIFVEKICGLVVQRVDKRVDIELPKSYSRSSIPFRRNQIPTPEVANEWPHLKKIAEKLHPYQSGIDVGLLIGCNCPRAIKPREVILGKGDDPYAVRTLLGWGIIGPIISQQERQLDEEDMEPATCHRIMSFETGSSIRTGLSFIPQIQSKEEISPHAVRKMFEMEFSESSSTQEALSQEDRKFLAIVESGIQHREDGHYELPLPLKVPAPALPNNREVALRRLNQLKRKFKTNQRYKDDYTVFMEKVLSNGFAEEVPPVEAEASNEGKVWYIPHHGVYHPKKPTKIRVVFDCSAEFRNESLNKHLLQGPDLTNNLVGVLCRFRKEPVALMGDIEGMFHQVGVAEQDRDLLRFLWWKDGDLTKEPAEYRMTVHLFGATSSPACANYALKMAANENEKDLGSEAANFIRRDFYVDDGLTSVESIPDAVTLIRNTREMCRRGGFKLHKFTSSHKEVIEAIPIEDRAEGIQSIDLDKEAIPMERALGVQWCVEKDSFQFRIVLKDRPCTRRGILSTVSSIYDPLGFVAPVLMEGKKILQELCRDKADWDDPVPENIKARWERWREELPSLEELSIPRCYKPSSFGRIAKAQLHHFSDASTQGYGQCSYLRLINDEGSIHCSFVIGKARVAPLKPVTVPRLELTAAVVSVRSSAQLQRELDYEGVEEVFWTDSKVVLGYISNETRRFHIFVSNRVQQIQEQSSPDQWHYVDTKSNPADHASRGLNPQRLQKSSWITGPAFLWKDQACWPEHSSSEAKEVFTLSEDDPEVKSKAALVTNTERSFASLASRLEYFSDYYRAKKAVALCLLYTHKLKERVKTKKSACFEKPLLEMTETRSISQVASTKEVTSRSQFITVATMQQAEMILIRAVQAIHFEEEIEVLTSATQDSAPGKNHAIKKSSALFKLDPFLDSSGTLRVGGRLKFTEMPEYVKFPVILPGKSHIANLIVKQCHEQVNHQGRGMTINEVRSCGYWIIGGSSAVASYIARCVKCRKLRGMVEEQKMADLPLDRSEPTPPFTFSAVDYFGPWIIKEGRREVKRYGVLFTCMASRAAHLESANSLDTASFINALRRFVCRRGPVRQLRSDQGSNFVGAKRELKEALTEFNDDQIKGELLKNNCDWITFKMNVPSASHMGGIWERQIRTVRSVLSAILEKNGTQLDDESLRTYLCECEAIINSRPLTVNNLNDPGSLEPLTPNHLLTLKSKVVLPLPGMFQSPDAYSRKRWRRVQHLANEFWCRWRKEFLLSLQQRIKWNRPRRNLSVGDIVIVKDDTLPRNCWQLARVSKTYPSKDGYIRSVQVDLGAAALPADGKREGPVRRLDRPVNKLVMLVPSDADKV